MTHASAARTRRAAAHAVSVAAILLPTGCPGHEMEQARYWRVARSKNGTKMRQREGRWKYKSVVMAGAILRQGRHDERNGRHIQMQLSLDQRRNES